MKNAKISSQLITLIAGLMIAFSVVTYLQIRSAAQAVYAERYDMLRMNTEGAISILKHYHQLEVDGKMTREEAQAAGYDAVEAIRFEPDGYFFGYDYAGTRVVYPGKAALGKNFADLVDKDGNRFLMNIIAKARQGGGWTEYDWSKPGQPK